MASTSVSSVQKRFKYDVFLSFRGEDTRKGFVDHLYHALHQKGITTFKDDEKIQKGERISEQLIKSIEDSRFYIIVFSKNYASSSWCLDELVKIMECQKMVEHIAYPVFYDVEPTEVRHQSGAVGEAFAKHEKDGRSHCLPLDRLCFIAASCFNRSIEDLENQDDVGSWRNALKEAAGLAGMDLKTTFNGHEAKLIQQIVQEISLRLHFVDSSIDAKLVGMETRVKNVVSSLETGSDDVRMIGIKGIGGGGKTTLARAVFDLMFVWFEGKSFVENVREVSKGPGLKELQKQIVKDVLNDQSVDVTSVSDGKYEIKRRMCSVKALIVLDDVDNIEQLEALAGELTWFKSGSRIIITTRDQQVLVAHGVNIIHDVSLLSDEEALCLFSRYAFKKEIPNLGYEYLSRQVIHYAAGLPLTIKVLGSHLCGRRHRIWKDAIERLKTIPEDETLKRLEVSYNGLENDQKEIFLDVVCILKGEEKHDAIRILDSCGYYAEIGLSVLEQKSLITISRNGRLIFHDRIEEMGWNIVRRSYPNEPSRHSRLWIEEEIEDILVNEAGTKATRSIKLHFNNVDGRHIMKGLRKMEELRLLYVTSPYGHFKSLRKTELRWLYETSTYRHFIDIDEDDEDVEDDVVSQYYLPDTLQSLCWCEYPFWSLPETFQANKLVNLEMRWSNIHELWNGGEKKVLSNLRFLDLRDSKLRTFDLRATPHLEVLNLKGCKNLVEFQLHVECLNLKILNLSGSKVSSINLGLAPHIERLYLKGCSNLREIQAPVGCLEKLVDFKLKGCLNFKDFQVNIVKESDNPDYVATFKIHVVYVDVCPVHPKSKLPGLIWFKCTYDEPRSSWSGNIEKLISFGPCVCENREYILATICDLQHLRELTLSGGIPQDLWRLQNLERLYLHDQQYHLPDSICMLKHLKSLKLSSCSVLEQLPENICELRIWNCKSLQDIPDSICKMKCLKWLELSICDNVRKLPEELGSLKCLEVLIIWKCKSLQEIPDSICKMKCLKSLDLGGCCNFMKLPEELGSLECLVELWIQGTGISVLPQSIYQLKGLCIYGYREQLESCGFTSILKEQLLGNTCYVEL